MLDLDAYLTRIGLTGRPDLAELHRAHVAAIPFENLDPRRGVPVSLEPEDLQQKLVASHRGGYCFEQNLLLKAALEALGAEVEMFLARVRIGAVPGGPRPRTHLVLGVQIDGARWHVDVGFGHGTLLEPIPFGPGDEHEQSGWRFRLVEDGPEIVLQSVEGGHWVDLYGFVPEPVPLIDVVTSNWYTCTHPRSPFVTGLIVSVQRPDGLRVSVSDWNGDLSLNEETPTRATITEIEPDALGELIASRFGLEAALV
jgi:N-hydroxyarylamine O-acetyltransferase